LACFSLSESGDYITLHYINFCAAPRTASVIANISCDVLVITRIELHSRFFPGCPELRVALQAMSLTYGGDDEIIRRWRHDRAWAGYRRALIGAVQQTDRPKPEKKLRGTREPLLPPGAISSLPWYEPPAAAASTSTRRGMDVESELGKWCEAKLDEHVLPSFNGLVSSTPAPVLQGEEAAAPTPEISFVEKAKESGTAASRKTLLKQPTLKNLVALQASSDWEKAQAKQEEEEKREAARLEEERKLARERGLSVKIGSDSHQSADLLAELAKA
jgi:hypothetical protein